MEKEKQVAQYLIYEYENITENSFLDSELMLQKLMYYAQKTSLALTGRTLFDEKFEAWVHGPVLKSLRFYFDSYIPYNKDEDQLTDTDKYIINYVIYAYGQYAPWKLRDMSHQEIAWKKARKGLSGSMYGSREIEVDDIKEDAKEMRLYDYQYDMYVDEFDDLGDDFIGIS
ncbi:MAG: DUF4065 domain-containing protein [Aerococcus sp.]|nr:DUF4065 domain-containing protein [Aerococcus sp.]